MSERSRRRCRKTQLPDATHYVGYVEDEETPEMIMKKFEELERIRAAASKRSSLAADAQPSSAAAAAAQGGAAEEEGPLDQEQLHAVFKATSMFNVKSVLSNNEALMAGSTRPQDRAGHISDVGFGNNSGSEDELLAELRGFWSDGDWGTAKKLRLKGSSKAAAASSSSSKREPGKRRARALQRNQRTTTITQYNRDSSAFIRRRTRVVDPDAIQQLRLPQPPLPLSWGRPILPYRQRMAGAASAAAAGSTSGAAAAAAGAMHAAAAAAATVQEAAAEPSIAAGCPAAASAAPAPRGLLHQQHALPASRNCDPASSSSLAPGQPLPSDACEVHVTPCMASFAWSSLRVQHYQAILINTGWEVRGQQQQQHPAAAQVVGGGTAGEAAAEYAAAAAAAAGQGVASWEQCSRPEMPGGSSSSSGGASSLPAVVQRLASLPIPRLCPRGFVMVWANKEHLSAVVQLMSCWGFSYIENLTWVLLRPSHSILRLPYPCLQRSHITLYIFRRDGEGRDIELRHQRNPDVVFDCVRAVEGREWDVPVQVFSTIETLLPTGKGLFLELWAAREAGRAGWTHIVEQQQQQ